MRNFKKLLSLVLCMAVMLSVMVVGAGAAFSDQKEIKNTEAVDACVALNIINGYTDGSYKPEGTITRAEACKMICVALNGGKEPALGTTAQASFTDTKGHWAEGYIESCVAQGIVAGVGGGKFNPSGNVTGTQFAKMLLIALGYKADVEGYVGAAWEVEVNVDASAKGLYTDLSGMDPSKALTRDNAAQMVWNTLNAYEVEYKYNLVTENGQLVSKVTVQDKVVGGTTDKITLLEDKYEAVTEKGVLTKVNYNDDDNTYTTKVSGISETFDATVDYSGLMGQQVKVMYTVDNKTNDVILLGIYATEKNKTVSAIVDDVDAVANLAADKTVEIDDVDYDLSKNLKIVAPNGATYAGKLELYYNFTLVDNNKDDEYEYLVVEPFTVAEVTTIASKNIYFTPVDGVSAVFSPKTEDVDAYDGMDEDDYAVVVLKGYTVSGMYEVTKAETISGTVAGLKGEKVKIDGTWYSKAADCTDSTPANNKDAEITVVNGFYFTAEGAEKTIEDVALVLAAGDTKNFASDNYDLKLLLSNGDVITTQGYVDDTNKTSPKEGSLYTVSKKTDYYKLTPLTNGKQVDLDKNDAVSGTYDPDTNKLTYGSAKSVRVASDAVVMVWYDGNNGKVVTGATAAKWSGDSYTVTAAFTDTTVALMAVNLKSADKVPNSADDTMYGVIMSAPYTTKDDDGDYVVFDLWTVNGLVEDVKVDIEEIEDAGVTASNVTTTFTKNMAITYEMSGDEYVTVKSQTKAGYVVGAVSDDVDGKYVTITTAVKTDEYKTTDDTVYLYVDTDNNVGVANGSIKKAASKDSANYYANVMVVLGDYKDGYYELDAIIVDINGQLNNKDGDPLADIAKP